MKQDESAAGDLQEILILNKELEHVRAEFERYTEAAHKAGVVFSVTRDGLIAEYNPALAKCVASWDADGEIEQPMPDKANEQLPTSSDTAGTEAAGQTVAGSQALSCGGWTPGPWAQSHRKRDGLYYTDVYDSSGETIATLAWHSVRKPNGVIATDRDRNAHLIAAAPDLYEALHELLLGVEEHSSAVQRRFLESAVNKTCLALAKAKGGA